MPHHLRNSHLSIIRLMARDPDIESQRLTLNLTCPISQTRIKDPCRFSGCDHYQCFDATSFLSFLGTTGQRSDTNLHCPICDREAPRRSLVIDLYFESILRRAPATTDEVYLQADGGWRTPDGQTSATLRNAASDNRVPMVVHMNIGTFFCVLFFLIICCTGLFLALLLVWGRLPRQIYIM
ncbi:hypothetical protein OPQ81_010742 [Rhizoctonia solani]|nr:hypothetical protein OPQ81_010742 [Rhizoctonia solani]